MATQRLRSQPRYFARLMGEWAKIRRKSSSLIKAKTSNGGLNRERLAVSVVSGPLSVVSCPLSVISCLRCLLRRGVGRPPHSSGGIAGLSLSLPA